MPEAQEKEVVTRSCYVGVPAIFILSQECYFIKMALGDTCYLVGSSTETRDFRDVDVRVIFNDDKFDAMFSAAFCPFWSLLCTSISVMLSQRTGLPVDFQIQKRSRVKESDWNKMRVPLGIFHSAGTPTSRGNT